MCINLMYLIMADINECQVDLHNCLPSQRCDNTIGSFQCVRYTNCGTGYTLNAQTGMCEGYFTVKYSSLNQHKKNCLKINYNLESKHICIV